MDGISKEAGVAKTTIYRRWPNAAAVIMDAFLDDIGPSILYRAGKSLRSTFQNAMTDFVGALDEPRLNLLRHLIASAQSDPELSEAFWTRWIYPRRQQGLEILMEQSMPLGRANAVLDLVFGAIYYRMLIPSAQIDDAWISEIVELLFCDIPGST